MIDIVQADVLEWAAHYDGPKFHALLCDPPYHLTSVNSLGGSQYARQAKGETCDTRGFMGKSWDGGDIAFRPETWAALGEHLLPGAFGMAFSGARTYHRMACAIEDAGFVLHSMIGWVYGSGFPKATRIDTQVDRAAGAEREVVGYRDLKKPNGQKLGQVMSGDRTIKGAGLFGPSSINDYPIEQPATDLARTWSGHRYGLQALKPALEPICVFQKPYAGRPVDSITEYGAGALWVEGGRVGIAENDQRGEGGRRHEPKSGTAFFRGGASGSVMLPNSVGRWPSNLILQHTPECRRVGVKRVRGTHPSNDKRAKSAVTVYSGPLAPGDDPRASELYEQVDEWQCAEGCPVKALGEQSGESKSIRPTMTCNHEVLTGSNGIYGKWDTVETSRYPDEGTAARFFQQCDWALEEAEPMYYCSKASRRERDSGLGQMVTPRRDLTQEQRAWLYAELERRGVAVSSGAQGQEHE